MLSPLPLKTLTLSHLEFNTKVQLSQRGRAMLRVSEYFAESIEVIQNNTF